jgi:uncharacterized membrane protein YcaP (DUF421 family)
MFFDNWSDLGRVALIGSLAYATLVLLLRSSGKRTLSKWNAFDLIVTIALGSTLATVLLSKDVSYAEGALALALLVALQFFVAWIAVRAKWFRRIIKAQPTFLYKEDRFLTEQLQAQRVTESEVRAAVRGAGMASMEDVLAVVLETDGSVSVLRKSSNRSETALVDVS